MGARRHLLGVSPVQAALGSPFPAGLRPRFHCPGLALPRLGRLLLFLTGLSLCFCCALLYVVFSGLSTLTEKFFLPFPAHCVKIALRAIFLLE